MKKTVINNIIDGLKAQANKEKELNKKLTNNVIEDLKNNLMLNVSEIEILKTADDKYITQLTNAIIETIKKSDDNIKNIFGDLDNKFLFTNIKYDIKKKINDSYENYYKGKN